MNQEPDSQLVQLAKALEEFPASFVGNFVALLAQCLTDPIVMVLVAGCVILGFLTNVWVAFIVFFFAYTLLRTISQLAFAMTTVGQRIGAALSRPPQMPQFPVGGLPNIADMIESPETPNEEVSNV